MSDDFDFDDDFFADDDDDFSLDDLRDDDDDLSGFDDFDFEDAGDDDLGGFDDFSDSATSVDDFDFGSDDDDLFADDDVDDDLGAFEDYDDGFFTEDEREESGTSRTFVLLAILMLVFFLIGIGLVLFLVLNDDSDSDAQATELAFQVTFDARLTENALVEQQALQTEVANQTQVVVDQTNQASIAMTDVAQQTQVVLDQTLAVEQATADAQATIDAQPTATPLVDLTAQAGIDMLTEQAQSTEQALQLTEDARNATPTDMGTSEAPDADSVAMTATALAQLLTSPTPSAGDVTPTQEGDGTTGVATIVPGGTGQGGGQLPETGLSVDFGSDDLPLIALVAFGLVGIIFGARQLRTRNNQVAKK